MKRIMFAGVFLAMLAAPLTVQAQGVPGGAVHGFHEGNRIAGPVGAMVGTAVGGVIGGVEGVLGVNSRASYRDASATPRRSYRARKAYRAKIKNRRQARHAYRR